MIDKTVILEYLDQPRDDYTWVKKMNRAKLLGEIDLLESPISFKTKPWDLQLASVIVGAYKKRFMFLLDMGLGKTKIVLDLMSYRKNSGKLVRALVVVPRLVNVGSWLDDCGVHTDLKVEAITGTTAEKWDRLMNGDHDIALIDYANAGLLLHSIVERVVKGKTKKVKERDLKRTRALAARYNMLVFDEIHRCKNSDTLRYRALLGLSKQCEFVYGLTGTPFGREPMVVFDEFKLVDLGDTFGTSKEIFRQAFFVEQWLPWGTEWVFNKRRTKEFRKFLRHGSIRYREEEGPDLPPRVNQKMTFPMVSDQLKHYREVVSGWVSSSGSLVEVDSIFVRLRQIASGYLEWDDPDTHKRTVFTFSSNPKLDLLEELLESSAGGKMVIFHVYTTSGRLICDRLTKLKIKHVWLYGGSKDPLAIQDAFKKDDSVRVLVANVESGGSGLNLQVARYMAFYESPVSPIDRAQAEKRCARAGQTETVHIYDLIAERSIEHRVLGFIKEGKNIHESLVNGRDRAEILKGLLHDL